MTKKPRENRVPIMMSEAELTAIDDWRFASRVATRSDAVRRLCKVALIEKTVQPRLRAAIDGLADEVTDLAEYLESAELEGLPEDERQKLKGSGFRLVRKYLDVMAEMIGQSAMLMAVNEGTGKVIDDIESSDRLANLLKDKNALQLIDETPGMRARLAARADEIREERERGKG